MWMPKKGNHSVLWDDWVGYFWQICSCWQVLWKTYVALANKLHTLNISNFCVNEDYHYPILPMTFTLTSMCLWYPVHDVTWIWPGHVQWLFVRVFWKSDYWAKPKNKNQKLNKIEKHQEDSRRGDFQLQNLVRFAKFKQFFWLKSSISAASFQDHFTSWH